jgi:hypothetical protein
MSGKNQYLRKQEPDSWTRKPSPFDIKTDMSDSVFIVDKKNPNFYCSRSGKIKIFDLKKRP